MKRADVRVGMEIAYGSDTYPHGPAIVIDTRPWTERREYMGRFGYMHTGEFSQEPGGRGVAVAEYDRASQRWRPGVVVLSAIRRTWADELERRERAAQARRESEDANKAYTRRVERLPAHLDASTVYEGFGLGGTLRRDRVTVDIDALEALIRETKP